MTKIEQKLRVLAKYLAPYGVSPIAIPPTPIAHLPLPSRALFISRTCYLCVVAYGHEQPGHIVFSGEDDSHPTKHVTESSILLPVCNDVYMYMGVQRFTKIDCNGISAGGLDNGVFAIITFEAARSPTHGPRPE